MKLLGKTSILIVTAVGTLVFSCNSPQRKGHPASTNAADSIDIVNSKIGALNFRLGVPTKETVAKLYAEMDFQRAVQCYLWAIPTVALEELKQAQHQNAGTGNGELVLYADYRSKQVILTANATTPYISAFIDLSENGPMVIDYPAGKTAGLIDDWWDRPVTDLGLAGPDKGRGGKYLIIGPGQKVPKADGYRVLHSRTFNLWTGFRVLEADPDKAKALQTGMRIFPFSQRDSPHAPIKLFTNKKDGELQPGFQPRGLAYWERLAQILNKESVEDRDRFFLAMLKPLGIEKNKPFQPNERQKKILIEAAIVGEAMAKVQAFDSRFEGIRYRSDTNWDYVPAPWLILNQDDSTSTQLDERTGLLYEAIGLSAASSTTTPGTGQVYLSAHRDKDGNAFDGGKMYHLHVPPKAPAKLFWSITIYDIDTRCLIQNKTQVADRSSVQSLVTNTDGSVDLYFGPSAPKGFEKNWVQTVPGKAWFTYFRLYGPLQPYFDKRWPLPAIELAK